MRDTLLEAQDTIAHRMDQTEKDPKERTGGGVTAKAPSLEREGIMLYILIGLLIAGMTFVLGFFLGKLAAQREELLKRVGQLESARIEHKNYAEYMPQAPYPAQNIPTPKPPTQSTVMRYKDPNQIRNQKERETLAIIDKEIEALSKGMNKTIV